MSKVEKVVFSPPPSMRALSFLRSNLQTVVSGIRWCSPLVCAWACLDPAPTYVAQQQIPPFIVVAQVAPPLNEVFEVQVGDPRMTVQVPFRSEDLGEDLVAVFLFDVRAGQEQAIVGDESVDIPASVYEDDTREVVQPINLDLNPGCHTLTMILTHASNLRGVNVRDETRAARATWLLNVRDPDVATSLESCPSGRDGP